MRWEERAHRRSPCKETELVWDYRTAGSEDGRNQGAVYLPSCARTLGCITGLLDRFQTEALVFRGSVYLPVSLSTSILPPTSTNLILSTSRSLVKVCQSKHHVFPAVVFSLWARKYRELMPGGKHQCFYIFCSSNRFQKGLKDIILDCWF